MPSLIAKITSQSAKPASAHDDQSVEALRNFEPWFLSATSDFFAVGEITFSTSLPEQFDGAPAQIRERIANT
jgi:hypothetical protein